MISRTSFRNFLYTQVSFGLDFDITMLVSTTFRILAFLTFVSQGTKFIKLNAPSCSSYDEEGDELKHEQHYIHAVLSDGLRDGFKISYITMLAVGRVFQTNIVDILGRFEQGPSLRLKIRLFHGRAWVTKMNDTKNHEYEGYLIGLDQPESSYAEDSNENHFEAGVSFETTNIFNVMLIRAGSLLIVAVNELILYAYDASELVVPDDDSFPVRIYGPDISVLKLCYLSPPGFDFEPRVCSEYRARPRGQYTETVALQDNGNKEPSCVDFYHITSIIDENTAYGVFRGLANESFLTIQGSAKPAAAYFNLKMLLLRSRFTYNLEIEPDEDSVLLRQWPALAGFPHGLPSRFRFKTDAIFKLDIVKEDFRLAQTAVLAPNFWQQKKLSIQGVITPDDAEKFGILITPASTRKVAFRLQITNRNNVALGTEMTNNIMLRQTVSKNRWFDYYRMFKCDFYKERDGDREYFLIYVDDNLMGRFDLLPDNNLTDPTYLRIYGTTNRVSACSKGDPLPQPAISRGSLLDPDCEEKWNKTKLQTVPFLKLPISLVNGRSLVIRLRLYMYRVNFGIVLFDKFKSKVIRIQSRQQGLYVFSHTSNRSAFLPYLLLLNQDYKLAIENHRNSFKFYINDAYVGQSENGTFDDPAFLNIYGNALVSGLCLK